MIRLLFLRAAAVVASVIFFSMPALAGFDSGGIRTSKSTAGMDMTRPRVWVDQTCTDTFNVPATTTNVSLTTVANWDTMEEAINPDKNIGDAVQTSGSADGWCDTTPWVIKGTFTMGASQNLFFGPLLNIPKQGFLIDYDFDAAITTYGWWFGFRSGLNVSGSVGFFQPYAGQTGVATLGPTISDVSPITSSAGSQYQVNFDNAWFVQGRSQYINLRTTGAGVFTFGMETLPLMPYYEEQ